MNEKGRTRVITDVINRSRLCIETRLELLAKWSPKKYGDKLDLDLQEASTIRVVIGGDA